MRRHLPARPPGLLVRGQGRHGVTGLERLASEGERLLDSGRFEEAAVPLAQACALEPGSQDLSFNLGLAYLKSGRAHDAKLAFERALSLGPAAADLLSNLGLAYFELGKAERAERCYSQALELEPGHPEANNNLGVLRFQEARYGEARSFFNRATQERPDYADAWFNLRDCCAELLAARADAKPGGPDMAFLAAERDKATAMLARLSS
ncbi:MAG TPA: hypothetical protein DCG47_05175 [Spirochaetaceae bacterium]|nr:hypothetical protein [Spirochaetaceae bacterium]